MSVAEADHLRRQLFSCASLSGGTLDRDVAEAKEAELGAAFLARPCARDTLQALWGAWADRTILSARGEQKPVQHAVEEAAWGLQDFVNISFR